MQNQITKLGAPVLRQPVPHIEEITDKEISLINKMRFFLSKVRGWGLAAPQIGVSAPVFVYNLGEGFQHVINPRVAEYGDEFWEYDEGCLSIPGFSFPIWRPRRTLLRGLDVNGNDIRIEATDLKARLFQHEVNHLEGKLVIDLLSEDELKEFKTKWRTLSKKRKR